MSGIYIQNISKPEGCAGICLKVFPNGEVEVIESEGDWFETTAVFVPDHGRLIDADALLARFEKEEKAADEHGRDFSFSFKSGGENCTEWWPVQQMLMDASTIIPAEEVKES